MRENGFYWVKIGKNHDWEVAEYYEGGWGITYSESLYQDKDFYKINENIITMEEYEYPDLEKNEE